MRVFFYVQNLLGVGHIFRALRISRALVADGFEVDLVLGGRPIPGLEIDGPRVIQLPPISAGPGGFADLRSADGRPLDASAKAARRAALLSAFEASRPDVVLIEAFPFGRRQMRFELDPLFGRIAATEPRPIVVSSVRDILQEQRKPGRNEETLATLRRHFDHVIVHGDPALVRLDATFPLAGSIADMISYSGLVAPELPSTPRTVEPRSDVVVSVGGGAVGKGVLEAAIRSKPLTELADARWLAITGTNVSEPDSAAISRLAASHGVELASFVPDLLQVLAAARLSISQAGYSSVADILRAGTRAVLVPFAAAGETEQTRRAALLDERGLAVAVSETGLDAGKMADAIKRALALAPATNAIDLDGAAQTAAILRRLVAKRSIG